MYRTALCRTVTHVRRTKSTQTRSALVSRSLPLTEVAHRKLESTTRWRTVLDHCKKAVHQIVLYHHVTKRTLLLSTCTSSLARCGNVLCPLEGRLGKDRNLKLPQRRIRAQPHPSTLTTWHLSPTASTRRVQPSWIRAWNSPPASIQWNSYLFLALCLLVVRFMLLFLNFTCHHRPHGGRLLLCWCPGPPSNHSHVGLRTFGPACVTHDENSIWAQHCLEFLPDISLPSQIRASILPRTAIFAARMVSEPSSVCLFCPRPLPSDRMINM